VLNPTASSSSSAAAAAASSDPASKVLKEVGSRY